MIDAVAPSDRSQHGLPIGGLDHRHRLGREAPVRIVGVVALGGRCRVRRGGLLRPRILRGAGPQRLDRGIVEHEIADVVLIAVAPLHRGQYGLPIGGLDHGHRLGGKPEKDGAARRTAKGIRLPASHRSASGRGQPRGNHDNCHRRQQLPRHNLVTPEKLTSLAHAQRSIAHPRCTSS